MRQWPNLRQRPPDDGAGAVGGPGRAHPPYQPAGKGKQERFWGSRQASFLPELHVQPADSLGQLNTGFAAWLEDHDHRRVHGTTGETPVARWGTGSVHRPQTLEPIRAAFRVVVDGCTSLL